jgi:hypothetical protein
MTVGEVLAELAFPLPLNLTFSLREKELGF